MKLTKKQLKTFDHISDEELEKDYREASQDVINCELALMQGLTEYSGGSIKERQKSNRRHIAVMKQVQAYRADSP